DEGKGFDVNKHNKDSYYLYNAKDSLGTHQIIKEQKIELEHFGVAHIYDMLIRLMPVYRKMEDTGLLVDDEVRWDLVAKYTSLYEIEKIKLQDLTGQQYLNPLSSDQMGKLIFEELGFKKIRGVKGTDNDSIETLLEKGEASRSPIYGKDILRSVQAARRIHKVLELLDVPIYPDGRFRGETNLAGTENGRTSGGTTADQYFTFYKGKVKMKNYGHSLQTIAKHGFAIDGVTYGKDVRRMFTPDPGYVFVEIDLKSAEARVDAVLAGNFDILPIFDTKTGIHRLTGSWVYNCEPDEIKKNVLVNGVDRYHVAKQVRHAGERNITPEGLISKLVQGLSLQEGRRILDTFHKKQPEIRGVYHREVINCINSARQLVAPNGRFRQFFDRVDNHLYNQAISYIPQVVVSDQMKFLGILQMAEKCKDLDFYFLVEAHDGCLALVREDHVDTYIQRFNEFVTAPIDFRKCSLSRDFSLVIPVEASISTTSWYAMEEVD
ncbi:MAG: DNA polymerase, partial [Candidatus Saccharimonadales bacterium]